MSSNAGVPSDSIIERTLRSVVKNLAEGSTVNDVRAATEKQLKLDQGFLKSGDWKGRSKDIIHAAINEEPQSSQVSAPSPLKTAKAKAPPSKTATKPATKSAPKSAAKPAAKPATKRASKETAPKAKRQKKADTESELSDLESSAGDVISSGSEEESPNPVKKAPRQKSSASKAKAEPEASDEESEKEDKVQARSDAVDAGSDSEMSEVLDEPAPKRGRKKSASTETKAKAKTIKATKATPAASKDQDPDEAEIKRLQGWLVKCGIRKLWHRELAPYDSPKAKMKHLKEMLKEAGMDGRYSVEKAKSIKEARELAADLEAVKEGAKKWGNDGEEEEKGSDSEAAEARPKRRAAAAARFVDFGDSGEDSD